MKSNVESRVQNFEDSLEKFRARWDQLKPGDEAMEGDRDTWKAAATAIREKITEFEDLEKTKDALM